MLTFFVATQLAFAAPGNVSTNLQFWFKADAGVTQTNGAVSTWADQSGNGNNVTQTNANNQPSTGNYMNFNPVISFNGDYLSRTTLGFVPGTGAKELFVVSKSSVATGNNSFGVSAYLGDVNIARNNLNVSFAVFDPADATVDDASAVVTSGGGVNATEWYSNTFANDSTQIPSKTIPAVYNYSAAAGATLSQYVLQYNGDVLTTPLTPNAADDADFAPNIDNANNGLIIGAKQSTTPGAKNGFLRGDIAEIIFYNRALTDQERAKVSSYLALKYGLTLRSGAAGGANDNYYDGNGNIVYDIANYTFRENIIGIGKDTTTGLDQRISKSESNTIAPAVLTVSTDANFVLPNNQHADTLTDGQYLVIGARGTTASPNDLQTTGHSIYTHRIKRDWRVRNTGSVGTVHLKFDGFNDEWYVLSTKANTINDYANGTVLGQLDANGEISLTLFDGTVFTLAKKKTTLTIDDVSVDESAGTVTLTITADEKISGGFSVDIKTIDGTAVAGQDYTSLAQTINFTGVPNESKTITISISDDTLPEGQESFTVALANPTKPTVDASDTATVTINDNDIATITISNAEAKESAGLLEFDLTLDKDVASTFDVVVSTVEGTAKSVYDFEPITNKVVTFNGVAGEVQKVSVKVVNDSKKEPNETFKLTGTASVSYVTIANEGVGKIINDDKSKSRTIPWSKRDPDKDGCTNAQEQMYGTDMFDPNSYSPKCGNKKDDKKKDEIIYGCMSQNAINYNPKAKIDDGSCKFDKKDEEDKDKQKDEQENDQQTKQQNKEAEEILNNSKCPHFTVYKKFGDTGEEVRKIQAFLTKIGLYSGPITGYYGKLTDAAIRAFQAKYADEILSPWGINSPTGRWYKTTRAKANELMGCKENKTAEELVDEDKNEPVQEQNQDTEIKPIDRQTLDTRQCPFFTRYFKLGDRDEEIKKIQIFLRKEGVFNYGEATGYYGPVTDRAIRAFQAKYADEILKPWGLSSPTGRWYKTTRAKANELAGCKESEVRLENGVIIR